LTDDPGGLAGDGVRISEQFHFVGGGGSTS